MEPMDTNETLTKERPSRRHVIRAAFAYDGDQASRETGLACLDPSRTDQGGKTEADINYIVEQFGVTGKLPQALFPPSYGDFSGAADYQTSLDLIRDAEQAFMSLPSRVRREFDNDPAGFVAFCEDPANLPQLREWGLAENPAPTGPTSVPAPPPDPAPAA